MIKKMIGIALRDIKIKIRSFWFPVLISIGLIAFSVLVNNYAQHIATKGVVVGDLILQPFRILFIILLTGLIIDSAIAIPSEIESRTFDWLNLQPVSKELMIFGKFLAGTLVFLLSLLISVILGGLIGIANGIWNFESVPLLLLSVLVTGVYMIGIGLVIGSIARTIRASVGISLLFILFFLIFFILSLWLELRPVPAVFDSYYLISYLVTQLNRVFSVCVPISLIINNEVFIGSKYVLTGMLAILQGIGGAWIASYRLKGMRK